MKFDSQLMARLQAATQQLLKDGPAASTTALRHAMGGSAAGEAPAGTAPLSSGARTFKDLNAAPDYAHGAPAGDGDAGAAPAQDLAGFLAGLGVRLPEGVTMPAGPAGAFGKAGAFALPEGFKLPDGFELPEGLSMPSSPVMRKRTPPPPVPAGATFADASFSNHAGTRGYKLYVPSTYTGQPVPLLVMLHGCTQDPDDFAAGTRMNQVAEETGCLVLYPAQSQQANQSRCWNWFAPGDQQHGRGEPAIIAGMTQEVMRRYAVDPRRVAIAGLSAGGAMAVIVGTLYPELFRAVGVHSGLPYGAAQDLPAALQAMKAGRKAHHGRKATSPPLIVFHGDKDRTVHAVNGEQVLADALAPHGSGKPAVTQAKAAGGRRYTRSVHTAADGRVVAEHWVLHGGGHAWAGGSASGSYTDPKGPDASRELLRFLMESTGDATVDLQPQH
ncbi:extracellular catalytic domain type 1 short-chain-length polyhydroxyalkanoate depolymerase [Pseudoduganella chitinolytica]|uniref:PHB depolymerase family esterase n=1 Tax=Pseudoduganella chitinolytica TaxID=34070 RepID=A0ABY8BE97_9BURK|nr:PHB depolymerase family esterase [Pseudoduganella chitinolytica]WEF34165.1 PHB depolymerase family esterase [Pseudoduganella chitinolytica]